MRATSWPTRQGGRLDRLWPAAEGPDAGAPDDADRGLQGLLQNSAEADVAVTSSWFLTSRQRSGQALGQQAASAEGKDRSFRGRLDQSKKQLQTHLKLRLLVPTPIAQTS